MQQFKYLFFLVVILACSAAMAKDKQTISKKQAAAIVTKEVPGKIIHVQETKQFYKVRVLRPKGKLVDVNVDKKQGKIKKDKKNADSDN
jgi:uncharacterized membrane protein YkoI